MTKENNIGLKPCPFCGGEAVMLGEEDGMYQVICPNCAANIDNYDYEKEVAAEKWNTRHIDNVLLNENEQLRKALNVLKNAEKEFLRSKYMGTPLEKIINDAIRQQEETFTEDFNETISGVLKTDRARLMEALELIQKTGQEKPFDGNACAYIAGLALSGKHATVEWQNIEKEINKEEDEMNLKGGKQ